MAALDAFSWDLGSALLKLATFAVVQLLVYLILSKSSNVFSRTLSRSVSFRPARSVSIRRWMAMLSDMPPGGEPSPTSSSAAAPPTPGRSLSSSPRREYY